MKFMHRRAGAIALDNQVFSVTANRTGAQFGGKSAVFDPRGDALAVAGEKEETLSVGIDLRDVERWRQEEPLAAYRRPRLYDPLSRTGHPSSSGLRRPPPPAGRR